MKKIGRYLIVLGACIVFGILMGVTISEFEIDAFLLSGSNFVVCLVLFALAMVSSIALHEMAHAVYFLFHKIPLRLVAIFFFCFYKVEGKWSIRIFPNKITVMGGIAIPDLPSINSESDFDRIRKIYSKALLFAPIVSLVEAFIFMVLYLILFFADSLDLYTNLSTYSIFCIFSGLTIFFSSFIKTENIYGDFPAYMIYKTNDKMAILQLCQYILFSDKWKETLLNSKWIIDKLVDYAKHIEIDKKGMLDIKILDWIIQMEYLGVIQMDEELFEILKDFFELDDDFWEDLNQEDKDIFCFHMMHVLLKFGMVEKNVLQNKYEKISSRLLKGNPSKEYYTKLTEHLLFDCDHSDWLYKNMNPNSSYTLLRLFDSVSEIEKKMMIKDNVVV